MNEKFDITVIVPLYNKRDNVAEALESIFKQKTKYRYKIVVVDDCSSDGSIEVVESYIKRCPDIITIIYSETNQGLFRTIVKAYAMLTTPYFCVLDPDDYWIDDKHIESALAYLSTHNDFTIYSAGIQTLHENGQVGKIEFSSVSIDSDFTDYLRGNAIIAFTQSCVYRNVVFSKGIPPRMVEFESETKEKSFRGDSFRNFLHIKEGKAHYSHKVEGCYRITESGVFQGMNLLDRLLLNAELFLDFWRYDHGRYGGLLYRSYELRRKAGKELRVLLEKSAVTEESRIFYGHVFARLDKAYKLKRGTLLLWRTLRRMRGEYEKKINRVKRSLSRRRLRGQINKCIRSARYVHLIYNDKFAKPYVDFLRRNFPMRDHVVICDSYMHFPFTEDECAFKVSDCFKGIRLNSPNIEKIICHSLYVRGAVDFFFRHRKLLQEKTYWVIYGGDLYRATRDKKNDFVRANFKGWITDTDGDEKTAREIYGANVQFVNAGYSFPITLDMIDAVRLKVSRDRHTQIQINNSCDWSTLGILDELKRFSMDNIVVTTVLSYGDGGDRCKQAILKRGKDLFGEKFAPILDYLDPSEYARQMAKNDVLILNQGRQQGLGNSLCALALGVKLFVQKDVTTYSHFNAKDIMVYDTNSIRKISTLEDMAAMPRELRERNMLKSRDFFKDDYLVSLWNKILK